ncbi:receptor-like protein 9DC3 [Citrus clementina]|uniref:receptor-like protein 9DC3 n=1 Tax=Citrus clementina TaxID=85681 RepID=UPI000CECE39D|nr:receptor-like protein 9DC3 [Citrus x clementina]
MLSPLCHSYERSALLQFKESLTIIRKTSSYYIWDPCHPKTASWKPEEANIDCCLWDGVECNENTGHVIKLDLSNSCLQGFINSSSGLFKLVHLEWLDLAFNYFICSEIPPEIINLSRLSYLNLSSAGFFGQIPSEILELSNLVSLDLSHNSYYNLIELKEPNLGNLVKKLTNLKELALGGVTISSPIPHSLANLSSLTLLSLSGCELRGRIPSLLGNLTKLMYLDLSFNNLLGELPTSIGNLDCLKRLDISWNELSGELPASIGNLASLEQLELSLNRFRGKTPHSMGNFTRLYWLSLASNDFSGELPASFGNLRSLEGLDISECKFSSQIPSSLRNLAQLKFLEFSHNNFSGPIDLDMFLGRIPRSLVNCSSLKFLDLGNNQISGTFPSWLGTLRELNVLILKSNKLHGMIREPNTGCGFPELRIIDLSNNRFTGKLPSKYFQCWNAMQVVNTSELRYMEGMIYPFALVSYAALGIYDYSLTMSNKGQMMSYDKVPNFLTGVILSSNRFDGEIPTSIANLKGLQVLSLANNSLHGHILSCLGNLTGLESLDLSNNKFSGQIPQQLVDLTFLEFFNVSNNNLTGPIPQGNQFPTFDKTSFNGNLWLCGKPLPKECENDEAPTNEDQVEGSEESLLSGTSDWKIILIGYAGGLIVGVVLGLNFSIGILEWFSKKFGMQPKRRRRIRRARNRM